MAHDTPRFGPGSPVARQGDRDRDPDRDRDHHRRPYSSPYRDRVPYFASGYPGWINPYFLGYPDSSGTEDSSSPPANTTQGSEEPPADQQEPQEMPLPRRPYLGPAEPQQASATPDTAESVTLIFKDGRAPQKIQNYILTKTTLYVPHHPDIPIDQLDLGATSRINQDAGIDFRLPEISR